MPKAKAKYLTYRTHAFMPDCQVKEGVPINHISAAGNYFVEKQPDVIICAGDFWDLPSLSMYDSDAEKTTDKRHYNGEGASGDIGYGNWAMSEFERALKRRRGYKPRKIFLYGNHENRIPRMLADKPWLQGAISLDHLNLTGWETVPFLQPIVIDGISYCHYYCLDSNGRVMNSKRGQSSAKAQVNNVGISATAGHKQGLDTYIKECPGGRRRGIIAGSFYQHSENYLSPQGNSHWSGILMKHEVRDGDYDLMEVSLDFLLRRYV